MVSSGELQKIHLAGAENAEKQRQRGGPGWAEEVGLSPAGLGESWGDCEQGRVRISSGYGKTPLGIYKDGG